MSNVTFALTSLGKNLAISRRWRYHINWRSLPVIILFRLISQWRILHFRPFSWLHSKQGEVYRAPLYLTSLPPISDKGYAGHKQMNHMGGWIYDPILGRLLQADPFIQAPKNSQNYNRYSYIL